MDALALNANARREAGHNEKSYFPLPALGGDASHFQSLRLQRLMDERVVPYPLDLVLDEQFLSFEFRNLQIVRGRVGQRFIKFGFERLVSFFEFRKMRFNRHVACLLASALSLI
jgi:hypothetical protein